LCRQYGYQRIGYYVSLLAAARGHRPLPSVDTLQSIRLASVVRSVSEELDETIRRSLAPLKSDTFELSIYFGANVAQRYRRLSKALFNQFPAPLLRATFLRDADTWRLQSLRPIANSEIPASHHDFVVEQAARYFTRRQSPRRPRRAVRYDLAILWDPDEVDSPSDERAVKRFVRAAREQDIAATIIDDDDYGRIAEYDALFIRQTTYVNHITYRFARRAAQEGLVVIDDPESIIRCTNKVYQAELFERTGIPCPQTLIVDGHNVDQVVKTIGLPCVLKQPDSSFSQGVVRVETREALERQLGRFMEESELAVAQEWIPSAFDWRVGVLDGQPLFVCRYHMARGHWQVVKSSGVAARRYGRVEAVALTDTPPGILRVAVDAAARVGNGLYGVDVKLVDDRIVVMEVNDNPNIDAGNEDAIMGMELYRAIMRSFRQRLDARGGRSAER
ncbi:MAG TPA: RimK family protein, partial [Gammaproteobacteria bacterium]